MKLRDLIPNWLFPSVGIAAVVGGLVMAAAYVELERKNDAAQAFAATLDRISHDHQLSMALAQIQQGEVVAAAQRLDLLLCEDVVRADLELPSADPLTRAVVDDSFRRIALIRPNSKAGGAAGSAQNPTDGQLEAERILTLALGAAAHTARAK